jgi:nucleoside-diphosphate-sugar epimerase
MNLQVLHVLSGAFMDGMFSPNSQGPVDLSTGAVTYWGTGDEPFDLTTADDTARFTARLEVDPDAQAGVHTISAGPTTYKEISRTIERATGKTLSHRNLGDEQQLREVIEAKTDPWDAVADWYMLGMLVTPTFASTENNRYADARPTPVEEYLTAAYGKAVV